MKYFLRFDETQLEHEDRLRKIVISLKILIDN